MKKMGVIDRLRDIKDSVSATVRSSTRTLDYRVKTSFIGQKFFSNRSRKVQKRLRTRYPTYRYDPPASPSQINLESSLPLIKSPQTTIKNIETDTNIKKEEEIELMAF